MLYVCSKDSDLSKAISIFREFRAISPEIFKSVFLGILESICLFSDAISLYQYLSQFNNPHLDYKFHLAHQEYQKIKANHNTHTQLHDTISASLFCNQKVFSDHKVFASLLLKTLKGSGVKRLSPSELRRAMEYRFESRKE